MSYLQNSFLIFLAGGYFLVFAFCIFIFFKIYGEEIRQRFFRKKNKLQQKESPLSESTKINKPEESKTLETITRDQFMILLQSDYETYKRFFR